MFYVVMSLDSVAIFFLQVLEFPQNDEFLKIHEFLGIFQQNISFCFHFILRKKVKSNTCQKIFKKDAVEIWGFWQKTKLTPGSAPTVLSKIGFEILSKTDLKFFNTKLILSFILIGKKAFVFRSSAMSNKWHCKQTIGIRCMPLLPYALQQPQPWNWPKHNA